MPKAAEGNSVLSDRYALYYPYIHIRDVNWLKATLLWFRQVRRIVPDQYQLKDTGEVKKFTELEGPAGPLLVQARIFDESISQAKGQLQKKIEDNLEAIVTKFARKATPDALADTFQIHRHKLLDGPSTQQFPDLLLEHNLAWHARTSRDADLWLAMHPQLGSAIMSALALAIARNEGLDVVTPDESIHDTLLAEREEDIFSVLLGLPRTAAPPSQEDLADDLAQLVLTTQFDYTLLEPNDIKTLIDEKKDLKRFRDHVAALVADIPRNIGANERQKRLEAKGKEIFDTWEKHRSILPKFAREALVESSAEETLKKVAEHLPELGATAIGPVAAHALGSVPGLALTIVTAVGVKMWRRKDSPFRFLNRVERAVTKARKHRSASLYLPQWSKLATT